MKGQTVLRPNHEGIERPRLWRPHLSVSQASFIVWVLTGPEKPVNEDPVRINRDADEAVSKQSGFSTIISNSASCFMKPTDVVDISIQLTDCLR